MSEAGSKTGDVVKADMTAELEDYSVPSYSPRVQAAIDELFGDDTDPLCAADFDVIAHINDLFPTEQSLATLDDAIVKVDKDIARSDAEIRDLVIQQARSARHGHETLRSATDATQQLCEHVRDIQVKTDECEQMVKEITRDIKQLDQAKKNLTATVNTLNHLHMLLAGTESLECFARNREYGEMANLLPGIMKVLEHFEPFMHIPQVKQLASQVTTVRTSVGQQITEEFRNSVAGQRPFIPIPQMKEMLSLATSLDSSVQRELMEWFVQQELSEYVILFEATQDAAWLDRIQERFAWFKEFLSKFERQLLAYFPAEWQMCERLAIEFCCLTATELDRLMRQRAHDLTAKLLKEAICKTIEFEERILLRRFPSVSLSLPVKYSHLMAAAESQHLFHGLLRRAFEPHLHLVTRSYEQNLSGMVESFATSMRTSVVPGLRPETVTRAEELQSASEMFMAFRGKMKEQQQLGFGPSQLAALVEVFKRCLREYARKCLTDFLPRISSSGLTSTAGLVPALLRETEVSRLSARDHLLVCSLLLTAEYCAKTLVAMQEKLEERLGEQHREKSSLASEQEVFYQVINSALHILVADLLSASQPALSAMSKTQWGAVESVGDESPYVGSIKGHIATIVPALRDYLDRERKFFMQFSSKFATQFIARYYGGLGKCKPGPHSAGANQLLLDANALKTALLELPVVGVSTHRKAPQNYTKLVLKEMSKIEMILKMVIAESSPADLVDSLLRQVPDCSQHDMQLILDMRCVRRGADTVTYMERLQSKLDERNRNSSTAQQVAEGETTTTKAKTEEVEVEKSRDSRIAALERLLKKSERM